ncbi:MAG: OmpA family protein [Hyphomicrobium sp.]|nr:OmpA family protein [Hyphomicrobium sp.]
MKHIFAVVLFAVIAGLVAVGVASEKGIHGLSQTVRHALGLPEGGAVVANIKSVGIEGADVSAKVAKLASDTKTKVAEVAEKAIEAAQPDRSKSVTPPADDQPAEPPLEAQVEPQVEQEAAAEQAAATEQQPPAAAAAPVAGVTHFYGSSEGSSNGTAVAAWAGAATMNPDYEPADATGETPVAATAETPTPAAEPAPEAAAEPAPAPAEDPAVAAAPAAEPDAPAPAAEAQAQAEPEAAPASLGVGVTSYYGLASKPDADQPWAAAAAANPDYAAAAESAVAEPAPEPSPEPAAAAEAQTAAEQPAPAATGGTGQTSYFGFAKMPDEDQPWAAPASANPDYTPGEAAAVVAAAPAEQPAATAPAAEQPDPPAAAEPMAAATETQPAEPAPAPTGDKGVSSYYGVAEKADANQPWAAAAAANPDYTAAVASPPEVTPATQEAVEACRDALNAEAQLGGLTFAVQRWDVTPENYGSLDKIAKLAKDCGGVVIEVRGHTDNTGRPKSNQTLSDLRAKAVIMYLTRAGVPLSKLKAVGLGEDKPVGDNATVKGRAQNRRIEFVVTPG